MRVARSGQRRGPSGLHIPYRDSEGVLTIGYGTMIDPDRGGGLTDEEAEYLLRSRASQAGYVAHTMLPWFAGLDDVRQEAIVQMIYQLGWPSFSGFRRMIAALARKDYVTAEREALDSKWAREDSPERAERVARAIRRGVW